MNILRINVENMKKLSNGIQLIKKLEELCVEIQNTKVNDLYTNNIIIFSGEEE